MRLPRPRSLAGQLFALQAALVAVLVAGCVVFAYVTDREQAEDAALDQVTAAARAIASSPYVREAALSPDPSPALQPYAEGVRRDTDITFVTIMDTEGVRWTHPNPERIGEHFVGHTRQAIEGATFTETYTGTLGRSVRVVTPVRSGPEGGGEVIALVSAGLTVEAIGDRLAGQVTALLVVAASALALGGAVTYGLSARLRRHTHGMNAAELGRMHDYHQATLRAVREGLLLVDSSGRVGLINDAGRDLLGLTGDPAGRHVRDLGLPDPLTDALLSPGPRVDEVHVTEDRIVALNTSPVSGGERHGTVVTLRDHTELQALAGELDSVRGFAEALRSQAHEAANRLHAVVSLIELGRADEAVEFATAELELAQALTDQVVGAVGEPVLAALLLGKAAEANERGVELVLAPESRIDDGLLPPTLPARDLVTILGNLVDNAVDAVVGAAADVAMGPTGARVTVTARAEDGELLLAVRDTGPGLSPEAVDAAFRRGWTTKPAEGEGPGHGLGLALVGQAVRRNGGTVATARPPEGGAEFTVRLPLRTEVPA
ncbi:sensor histidine kinase [Streptomyces radicis]|uniref:histidine kinase n=1 Tax=Streptomyces radicis TaxID=1750517 RepID=A0A3A9WL19_9ACTN|nr:sensor histidine kinase [Streptomyces radicis]RKN08446.1 sensor histidine kinase [Streptomyces radicis]RKN21547.1 sensor histidine kinase [Streptomyces radicis]